MKHEVSPPAFTDVGTMPNEDLELNLGHSRTAFLSASLHEQSVAYVWKHLNRSERRLPFVVDE